MSSRDVVRVIPAESRPGMKLRVSVLIRRCHMYLALLLTPWILMYALSTAAMNHREWLTPAGEQRPAFEKEREETYSHQFAPGTKPAGMARQILRDLGLDGTHTVNASAQGQRLTIVRQDPITPRRITFTANDQRLVVEKQIFRTPAFLERLHRRRGYQHPYALENTWAFSVDLVIFALVFWVLSGLWLWWEMKKTRLWGAAFACGGLLLFGLFLARI